jgi:EAL domain-containing protein (putative c-di-GMP-specific phosphodiesterase class I)
LGLELHALRLALDALPSIPPEIRLNVNASPDLVLTEHLGRALEGAPLGRLVLEITEHAAIEDYGPLNRALGPLRARGLGLAVDDAGAGYASFRHVLNLKPDFIKLDVSLTRSIDSDPARAALAGALIAFARETGGKIVAEGVETASELRALEALKVDKVQGYFLGKPMPLEHVIRTLTGTAADCPQKAA